MTKAEFDAFIVGIAADLSNHTYPRIYKALIANPELRRTLNPAFPFPRRLRIGLMPDGLAIEHVGPEKVEEEDFPTEATEYKSGNVYDFLGVNGAHLRSVPRLVPKPIENAQFFVGASMQYLLDYFYDFMSVAGIFILNALPDLTFGAEPTYVWNTTIFYTDADDALRTRRIDLLELWPLVANQIAYRDDAGLADFADWIISKPVPNYDPELHRALNEFIVLINSLGVDEPSITRYLSDNAAILQLAFGAHELNPQTLLKWQYETEKRDLQPDFMPIGMDGFADILEFKLPRLAATPTVGKYPREMPSHEVNRAIAQIDSYEEYCAQEVNRQWVEATYGIKLASPRTTLVMGHSKDFTPEDRRRLRARRNISSVFTYDEFIDLARMQLYRVR